MPHSENNNRAEASSRRTEIHLIRRAQKRDAEAMRLLIERHKDRLFCFVSRMIRNHHDAEEVCQDAFLKAFASLDSFDTGYRFSTWLFTIAYRLALNLMRRKKPLAGDVDFSGFAAGRATADDDVAASEEARYLKSVIWEAVDRLTPVQKATVLLFYKQQQSCHEIGAVLEIPVATVKSHLHRARARLKDLLEPQFAGNSNADRILGELAG